MTRLVFTLVLVSTAALARDIEVPLGERAEIKDRRAIHEVTVRDPSMLTVVVTDGKVSIEGKQHGTTGVTVKYADGELERILVIVGNATNTKGPRIERAQSVDLKQSANAQAQVQPKAASSENKEKAKLRDAVHEASGAVRAAVEAL